MKSAAVAPEEVVAEPQLKLNLEDRIKAMMSACDVDNDGVISYAEFLWAMTGAEGLLGEIATKGPQKGDIPPDVVESNPVAKTNERARRLSKREYFQKYIVTIFL